MVEFFCIFTVVVVMGVYVFLKIHKLFNKKHIHFKELFKNAITTLHLSCFLNLLEDFLWWGIYSFQRPLMLLPQSLPITVLWKGHSLLRYYISQSSGMPESLDYSYPQWAVEFFHFLLLPWSEKGSTMLLDNSDFLICWNSISLSARCTLISPSFSLSWNKFIPSLYIEQGFRYLKICYPFSHSRHHQLFSELNVSGSLSCSSHGMFLRFSIVPETWSLCSVFQSPE